MNVIKCFSCGAYIENKGENYYQVWELIKGTRKKQCVLSLCNKCKQSLITLKEAEE